MVIARPGLGFHSNRYHGLFFSKYALTFFLRSPSIC